jgi:hypothetical protein
VGTVAVSVSGTRWGINRSGLICRKDVAPSSAIERAMSTDGRRWAYVREFIFATVVIALTFLNYGHVAISASGDFRVTPDSWCGDPVAPGSADHAPCNACRIGHGADIPQPPGAITPVTFRAVLVAYVQPFATIDVSSKARPAQPRGPPSLI